MVIRFLVVILVAVLAACAAPISPSPQPSGSGVSNPSESASVGPPTPSTSGSGDAPTGTIVQVLVDGLRVRDQPGLVGVPLTTLAAGQRARVKGGPQEIDGHRWYQLSFSPSGTSGWVAAGDASTPWIAVVANGKITAMGGREVLTMDADGTPTSVIRLDEGWYGHHLSWAPNGIALAMSQTRQDVSLGGCVLEGRVATFDDKGQMMARTSPPAGTWDTNPIWSPDSSEIAFTREKQTCATQNVQGFPDLYVMPVRGGQERLVVSNARGAVWSPAGDAFAFTRFDATPTAIPGDLRGPEIWMIAADGTGERRIGGRIDDGTRERVSGDIAWAPDGSVIAFSRAVGDDLNSTEIDLIATAGQVQAVARLTDRSVLDLTWLPDGAGLAFIEQRIGTVAIVVLSPVGEAIFRAELTDGVPNGLVVAPDGSATAWGISGTSLLRVQPLTGGDARTYTITPNNSFTWQALLLDQLPPTGQ